MRGSFWIAMIFAVSLASTGCGSSRSGMGAAKIAPTTPPGGNQPTDPGFKEMAKDMEIVSSAKKNITGALGSKADIAIGSPLSKVQVKTSGGYKVFLTVAGSIASDQASTK